MFKLLNILSKIVIKAYYKEAKCLQAKANTGMKLGDKLKAQSELVYNSSQATATKAETVQHKADALKDLLG